MMINNTPSKKMERKRSYFTPRKNLFENSFGNISCNKAKAQINAAPKSIRNLRQFSKEINFRERSEKEKQEQSRGCSSNRKSGLLYKERENSVQDSRNLRGIRRMKSQLTDLKGTGEKSSNNISRMVSAIPVKRLVFHQQQKSESKIESGKVMAVPASKSPEINNRSIIARNSSSGAKKLYDAKAKKDPSPKKININLFNPKNETEETENKNAEKDNKIIKSSKQVSPNSNLSQVKSPKKSPKKPTEKPNLEESLEIFSPYLDVNDYEIIKQIGQGSFGKIFMVRSKSKRLYALKKLIAASQHDVKNLESEYQILLEAQKSKQEIDLVKIYGMQTKKLDSTTYCMYVLMELANTDWEKEILNRQKKRMYYSEQELMTILSQLVNTFALLQNLNISHRDIKPQNILVFKENNAYKPADFGEAKELYDNIPPTNRQTLRGTELYMSPILFTALRSRQVIKYVKHNPFKSDVFSFGLCAFFAATLCFESLYDVRELKNSFAIKVVVDRYLKRRYSKNVIEIIAKMLEVQEELRPDFVALVKDFENFGYKIENKEKE